MTSTYASARNLSRRLWPSPERFAAAAALQDPSLLMRLQATRQHGGRAPRRRSGIPAAIRGETGGALLDQAKVGILATALPAPVLAAAALAPLRRRVGDSGARRRTRVAATLPCAA
jgi:hypothetical protein